MCYSTNCLLDCLPMCLDKYFKRVPQCLIQKGPLSDHLPTVLIAAKASKEVLKAVAKAKEPQKKGPYIKFIRNTRQKLLNLLLLLNGTLKMEIAI